GPLPAGDPWWAWAAARASVVRAASRSNGGGEWRVKSRMIESGLKTTHGLRAQSTAVVAAIQGTDIAPKPCQNDLYAHEAQA
ncbi:MAG: hypothetical protein KGN74_08230, partial [Gemmatimonadota bacterium]|nr:hypothetical protein [Gemmatimonadota bacterium]